MNVAAWVAGYERAWRSPDLGLLPELFTPDATYAPAPFDPVLTGLDAIAEFWTAERDGPDEVFTMSWEPVAVDGPTAVLRVDVTYGRGQRYLDLWIVTFGPDGRCAAFEEWPFAPGQPRVAPA